MKKEKYIKKIIKEYIEEQKDGDIDALEGMTDDEKDTKTQVTKARKRKTRQRRKIKRLTKRINDMSDKINFIHELNADMVDVMETFFDEVDDQIDVQKSKKEWLNLIGRQARGPYFRKTLRT